ncbi:MAG: 3-hydroxyacyl-CoA dehydrogenase family protein [Desulfobacterales bacterium]|nr:MAG: 3-hydroxyacyl-CoA dehydrogenase family protein [Desulfobacterales bacterium]
MVKRQDIQRVVVVGSGQMGPGIAYTLASVGCSVSIYARTPESVERGLQAYQAAVNLLVKSGCISAGAGSEAAARLSGTTELEDAVARADLVIESIAEDLKIKQELFARIEKACPSQTLLTSNTSGLPVTQLASVLRQPERFAVTHFWNPPHLMPLVEVVKGEKTAPLTIDTLVAVLQEAGKKPVVVLKDTPGQLGNRLFHALIREAIWIVQEGIAAVEDVDTAIKNGLGRRFPVYGALEHQDVAGLDTVLAIQSYMAKALCNETAAGRLLREKVAAGDLGVKSGRGFYDWSRRDIGAVIEKRDAFLVEMLKAETAAGQTRVLQSTDS